MLVREVRVSLPLCPRRACRCIADCLFLMPRYQALAKGARKFGCPSGRVPHRWMREVNGGWGARAPAYVPDDQREVASCLDHSGTRHTQRPRFSRKSTNRAAFPWVLFQEK